MKEAEFRQLRHAKERWKGTGRGGGGDWSGIAEERREAIGEEEAGDGLGGGG